MPLTYSYIYSILAYQHLCINVFILFKLQDSIITRKYKKVIYFSIIEQCLIVIYKCGLYKPFTYIV